MIQRLGNEPEGRWENLKEPIIFEMTHDVLRMSIIKTLKGLRASEGKFQIVHLETGRRGGPGYAVFDEFTVRLRGGRNAPEVRRGDVVGELFPPDDFLRWWNEAFQERKTVFGTGYYHLRLHSVKPEAHAKIQEGRVAPAPLPEPAAEEIPLQEPEPIQAPAQREPEALPEDAVEFSSVNDLKNRAIEALDGFRERPGGKVEATLTIELEDRPPVSMRVEHPGGRTLVVWAYPEEGKRFSLVGREVVQDITGVTNGGRISRISLSPRPSE